MSDSNVDLFAQFLLTQSETLLPQEILRGIATFGATSDLLRAKASDWTQLGVAPARVDRLMAELTKRSIYERAFARLAAHGIGVVSYFAPEYPTALKNIASPPVLLFFRGAWPAFNTRRFLAVVGTRRSSDYGRRAIQTLLPELCAARLGIVSGLAFGIDALAHEVTLSQGGLPVAVLAKGVEQASPQTQQPLYERVYQAGSVLSEFAFSDGLASWHFPRRNRIVSGLCEGVLVIEAPEKSGAMITANFALEQNRQVYAVPGGIFQKQSEGCLLLLRQGAKLVLKAQDVLDDYALVSAPKIDLPSQLSALERRICDLCADGAKWKDEVYTQCAETFSEVSTALTQLELAGLVVVSGSKVALA